MTDKHVSEWVNIENVESCERTKFEEIAVELGLFGCSLDREVIAGVDSYKHAGLNACWLFWQKRAGLGAHIRWKVEQRIFITEQKDSP